MGRSILLSPPDLPSLSSGDSDGFFPSINSYDGKVMLAAIVSLLLVISFVLLLHVYARWLLGQAQQRRRLSVSSPSYIFDSTTLHHHIRTTIYDDNYADTQMNGLDESIIASLPLFVYKSDLYKHGLDCVICLSVFEDDEMGRNLPKCKHAFHVECIDMWLQSHSGCPICRAPVGPDKSTTVDSMPNNVTPEDGRTPGVVSSELVVVIDANSPSEVSVQTTPNLSLEGNVSKVSSSQPLPPPPPPPPLPPVARPSSSLSSSSLLPSPSTSLSCSLKRMLSRSRSEHKVFPSSTMNDN